MTARSGSGGTGPFRLDRVSLAGQGDAFRGPELPVSDIRLAGGYVWVTGPVVHANKAVGIAFYQVNPVTLRVIRSWVRNGPTSSVPVTTGRR